MSDGVHEDMLAAARQRLLTVAGIGALGKAVEGFPFQPTIGTPYWRDALVPIGSNGRTNMIEEHLMLYTVNFFYPSGGGTKAIGALADSARRAFLGDRQLFYGTHGGKIIRGERKGILTETDWLNLPLLITIQSFEQV